MCIIRPHGIRCGLLLVRLCVCVSVCLLVMFVSPAKAEPIDRDAVSMSNSGGPKEPRVRWGSIFTKGKGQFLGVVRPIESIGSLRDELCQNGWTDRDDVWGADYCGPKEPSIGRGRGRTNLFAAATGDKTAIWTQHTGNTVLGAN